MTERAGAVLLDCEGLSLALRQQTRQVGQILEAARRARVPVVVSALTVVEAAHGRFDIRRLDWALSGMTVEGVEPDDAKVAVRLLRDAGNPSGHEHATDALVAALALRLPRRVLVLTSDPTDWRRLAGDQVDILRL